ncbi:MAG: 1-acyl-sn-glycerol-3-phosphate acyltransferase [Spirochaetaceae bacterium]|nr:1-acyl-sn-glycerol-3-phosphate acyltransferase [Spirochaetaceae bacterium]
MERKKIPLEDSYWMPGWFRVFHHVIYYLVIVPLIWLWLVLVNSLQVHNRKVLQGKKRCILVSNHSLILDPAIANMAILPRRSAYAIKEQLMNGRPALNLFLRSLGGYPLHYGRLRELDDAVSKYLDEYGFAHFFPEGHEGWGFQNQKLNRFNSGAFYFAMKLKTPVIPVVIVHFSRRIFGKNLPFLPRRVVVVLLDPVDSTQYLDTEESLNKAAAAMASDVRQLMQDCIDDYHTRRG